MTAVGVDRRTEGHPLRQPLANQRRQRRLHDGDASAHHDGRGIEHRYVEHRAAQTGHRAGNQQARDQRGDGTETRDQERSRQRRDPEQNHRQARKDPHLGPG
jgi:hypothetical protein